HAGDHRRSGDPRRDRDGVEGKGCGGNLAYHVMARVPNADGAILDIRRIADYCLSPVHPRGRHKARVFRDALGLSQDDARWLQAVLLDGLRHGEAIELSSDDLGSHWRVDVPVTRHAKSVVVRTIWIVRSGEQQPRFVTCWVL
ncbi:MAG: DUF6883 domain-containing protein, partial [Stellaceae bacterium]